MQQGNASIALGRRNGRARPRARAPRWRCAGASSAGDHKTALGGPPASQCTAMRALLRCLGCPVKAPAAWTRVGVQRLPPRAMATSAAAQGPAGGRRQPPGYEASSSAFAVRVGSRRHEHRRRNNGVARSPQRHSVVSNSVLGSCTSTHLLACPCLASLPGIAVVPMRRPRRRHTHALCRACKQHRSPLASTLRLFCRCQAWLRRAPGTRRAWVGGWGLGGEGRCAGACMSLRKKHAEVHRTLPSAVPPTPPPRCPPPDIKYPPLKEVGRPMP